MRVLGILFWLLGTFCWLVITRNIFNRLEADDFSLAMDGALACAFMALKMAENLCKAILWRRKE